MNRPFECGEFKSHFGHWTHYTLWASHKLFVSTQYNWHPGPQHKILFGHIQGQPLECIMNGYLGLYLDSAFQSPILSELNSSNRYWYLTGLKDSVLFTEEWIKDV